MNKTSKNRPTQKNEVMFIFFFFYLSSSVYMERKTPSKSSLDLSRPLWPAVKHVPSADISALSEFSVIDNITFTASQCHKYKEESEEENIKWGILRWDDVFRLSSNTRC